MSYRSVGDVNRYQLLTGGVCYDLTDKKQVDKKLCDANPASYTPTAVPIPASMGSKFGFGLPGWLLPVGVGVGVFLYLRSRK